MEKGNKQFAILGIGRFGQSIIKTLSEYDVDILACDKDPQQLHHVANYATHLVQADLADESALESMGIGNFDVVVVATKELEASLVATMMAKEAGVETVVVKATGERQKKILENIGADLVVQPEYEIGAKIGRELVENNILDILGDSALYTIVELKPQENWIGKTIGQLDIRKTEQKNILAIQRGEDLMIPVLSDHTIQSGDILIAISEKK